MDYCLSKPNDTQMNIGDLVSCKITDQKQKYILIKC